MFRNYLKIAVRNLVRHKGYSLINIVGLAIGMACCILILLFVQDELSYDRYHENAERVYRVTTDISTPGKMFNVATTPAPMAPALVNDYPEVISAGRFASAPPGTAVTISYGDKRFNEERFFFGDSTVFDVFTFPLIKGNPKTALKAPYSIVVTEEMARKYFGDENPMNKTIAVDRGYVLSDFKITGILQHIPHNSHFRFDFLASFATLESEGESGLKKWGDVSYYTYLLLAKDCRPAELEQQFPEFIKKYMGEESAGRFTPQLQPLTGIHLHSDRDFEIEPNSNIAYVYVFSAVAFFILLIACVNFMNLSTARSANRAKEVGMRKVVGAHRLQLIKQFLGESVLLSCIALLLAVALVELALPAFNTLAGKELVIDYGGNLSLLLGLVGIFLFVGIVSGSYPALFLSAFQPVDVLKRTLRAGSKSPLLRKILVILQFVISIILIIGTGIIYDQLSYVRGKRLGFQKEHVVVLPILKDRRMRQHYESIKRELSQNSYVLGVSASSSVPGGLIGIQNIYPEGTRDQFTMHELSIDDDFIDMFEIELIAGRNFSKDFATDTREALLLNEAAAKRLGWESPSKALGKRCEWWDKEKRTVIGIVKDFHISSLHHKIEPVLLTYASRRFHFRYLSVKIRPDHISDTLAFLKNKWEKLLPSQPFEYFFLDDSFDKLYNAEHKLGKIFGFFSMLAIFIACLGLFGLTSFATEQRTKEIGIRKVLGASISGIVLLLSKEFTKLVIVSNLIAWPVAYWAMNRWLQDFAYRIHIGVGTFLLAGVLALAIALLTLSSQVVKVALSNPVKALRYE